MKRLPTTRLALALALSPMARAAGPGRIACNLKVCTRAERVRHLGLIAMLEEKVSEMREVPGGYAFRYAPGCSRSSRSGRLGDRCCPFIGFPVELEPQPGGSAWLRLRGNEE